MNVHTRGVGGSLTEYVRVTKEGDLCYNNTSYGKEGTFLGTV